MLVLSGTWVNWFFVLFALSVEANWLFLADINIFRSFMGLVVSEQYVASISVNSICIHECLSECLYSYSYLILCSNKVGHRTKANPFLRFCGDILFPVHAWTMKWICFTLLKLLKPFGLFAKVVLPLFKEVGLYLVFIYKHCPVQCWDRVTQSLFLGDRAMKWTFKSTFLYLKSDVTILE